MINKSVIFTKCALKYIFINLCFLLSLRLSSCSFIYALTNLTKKFYLYFLNEVFLAQGAAINVMHIFEDQFNFLKGTTLRYASH